jgi:integrase
VIAVDFMRGIVHSVQQGAGEELKTETSQTPLPIQQELALELSAAVARWGGEYVVTDGIGRQTSTWAIERAVRGARPMVAGLPDGFRFHDLRHYLASLLIGSRLDVKSNTGCGTDRRRRPWTPTGICGPTATSPHGQPLARLWLPRADSVRTAAADLR